MCTKSHVSNAWNYSGLCKQYSVLDANSRLLYGKYSEHDRIFKFLLLLIISNIFNYRFGMCILAHNNMTSKYLWGCDKHLVAFCVVQCGISLICFPLSYTVQGLFPYLAVLLMHLKIIRALIFCSLALFFYFCTVLCHALLVYVCQA